MKKVLLTMIGVITMMAILTGCSTQKIQTIGADSYYVQIVDGGEEYETGYEPRYRYTLDGFDKNGEQLELQFTAGHQLKEAAYLRIYVKKDEVKLYEEVDQKDLPKKAYDQLQ